ncbi:hypothetical protein P3T76_014388 [Phytophthora citrophthora]|uniref:Serine protease n=1 Tax=Phytophthora citrophthora TaxID=4793 RepID=A0AAD9LB97_9STRA|nr:hypothetical protein P3T76_014388 [Phytophthora citrophthora]
MIVDDHAGAATAVFFTSTLAATCDHNLTEHHTVGSTVSLVWKENKAETTVVARILLQNFAILKSPTPRSFIAPWNGNPNELLGRRNLALVFPITNGKLAYARPCDVYTDPHRKYFTYSCVGYAGASGPALLVMDGCLVGIHLGEANEPSDNCTRRIKGYANEMKALYALVSRREERICLLASVFKSAVQ